MDYTNRNDIELLARKLKPEFDATLERITDGMKNIQKTIGELNIPGFRFSIAVNTTGTRNILNSIYSHFLTIGEYNSLVFAYAVQVVYEAIISDMISRVYSLKYDNGSYSNRLEITDAEIKSFFEFMKRNQLDPFIYIRDYEQTCQGYSDLYCEIERIMTS